MAAELASGKGHKDENFPVASWLIEARYRAPVMAFYRFARTADDVADHATATARERLRLFGDQTIHGSAHVQPYRITDDVHQA